MTPESTEIPQAMKHPGEFTSYDARSKQLIVMDAIEVAPAGHVGIKCEDGHWAIPANREFGAFSYHRKSYWCANGDKAPVRFATAAVQESHVPYLGAEGKSKVLNGEWFHASPLSKVKFPSSLRSDRYVHLGTRIAATDWDLVQSRGREESFLYSVKLSSEATVSDDIHVESDAGSDIREKGLTLDAFDIYRYVNVKEDPGSVSVLIRPSAIVSADLVKHVPAIDPSQDNRPRFPQP